MARTSAGAGVSLSTGGLLRSMGTSWMAASTPRPATRIHRRRLTLRLFVFSSGNSHSEFPSSSAGGIMAAKPTQRTRKGAVPVSRYRPRESRARPRNRTLVDQSKACPPLFAAVEPLRGLLSSRGHPAEVVWLFREDFYHA